MNEPKFQTVIGGKSKLLDFKLKEIWNYRDLIYLLIRRTFTAQYKQTILGPLWAIIQPLLTTVVFTIVFGGLAGLSTDGVPPFLFYMCGTVSWGYFSTCFTTTATTFTANAAILGKVYFPRLVMPISSVLTQIISFFVQFIFFLIFLAFYLIKGNEAIVINWNMIWLTPILILQMAMLGLGFGIIVSALTVKYRDLVMLINFGVQLWMYLTPVAYSLSVIPEKYMSIYMLNPMTSIVCAFRYIYLGNSTFNVEYYSESWIVTIIVLVMGVVLFNRVEKTFMDTV